MENKLKQLYVFLFVYSIATGLFLSHEELWLQANDLTVSTIGIILSVGTILACITIFIFSNYINKKNIKEFINSILIFKSFVMGSLFLLNQTENFFLIKLFIMIDYILNIELISSIYPFMAYIKKDSKVYAYKEILIDAGSNIGVVISVLLLGRVIFNHQIDYNFLFIFGTIINIISIFLFNKIKLDNKEIKQDKNSMIIEIFQKIKKNKTLKNYFAFRFFNNLSYFCIIGISLLLLTEGLNYSLKFVNNWQMITLLISALVGFIFTRFNIVKNDYLAIIIKFGLRIVFYILAIIFVNNNVGLLAITYTLLSCLMFPDITDGKYINIFTDSEQLAVANLNEIISRSGRALGIYLCSVAITSSIKMVYIYGIVFGILQLIFIILTIQCYRKDIYDRK